MTSPRTRAALYGAVVTVTGLVGGLLLAIAAGNLIRSLVGGRTPEWLGTALATLVALVALTAGAAAWGAYMGRLTAGADRQRMAWVGALGFVPVVLVAGFGLLALEPVALRHWGERVPLYRLFTILFVPTAAIVAGVGAVALGLGLKSRAIARALAWRCALAAGLAFLAVDLTMEVSGWRVGAPGAAERLTMLTVLSVSALGAAIAAGAVIGALLNRMGS